MTKCEANQPFCLFGNTHSTPSPPLSLSVALISTACLEGSCVGNWLKQIPAVYGATALFLGLAVLSRVLLRKPRRRDEDVLVDESVFSNFKLVGKVHREYELDEIPTLVKEMQRSYASGITRPLAKRKEQIRQLRKFFVENEERIIEAIKQDLGRPRFETLFYDCGLPIAEIDEALRHLDDWAAPESVGNHILAFPRFVPTTP